MSTLGISETQDYLLKDGKPFFYLADTVWAAFPNLSIGGWARYLAYRRMQGFNALQISILPITNDASTSEDSDEPFVRGSDGNWDFYHLNDAYFDKAERMVAMATAAGFLPVLGLLWKCYVPGTGASRSAYLPSAMPLDALEAYVEYAVQRFAPHAPAFFTGGDTPWDSDQEPAYYMRALEIARRICPDALITMHLAPSAMPTEELAARLDFYMYQSGHGAEQSTPYELAKRHLDLPFKRPVLNGEPCYEGHGRGRTLSRFGPFDVRKATWQSLLSGAKVGITYGAHGVWSFHSPGMGFLRPEWKFAPYNWEDGLRLPGAWDVAYAKWLFEHFQLFDLNPVDLLVRQDPEVAVAASPDHGKLALYMPHAYDLDIEMDLGGYRCEVFDLGTRRPMVPVVEPGSRSTLRLSLFTGDALFIARK